MHPALKIGEKSRVFPGFHRVFNSGIQSCNIQQLSTDFSDSQIWDLPIVINSLFRGIELKLFTNYLPEIYINDKLCTAFPPELSTAGGYLRRIAFADRAMTGCYFALKRQIKFMHD